MKHIISVRQAMEISGLPKHSIFYHYRKGRIPGQMFADVLAIELEGFKAFVADFMAGKFPVGRPKKAAKQ